MPLAIVEVAASALAANTRRRISAIASSSGAASQASSARWPARRWPVCVVAARRPLPAWSGRGQRQRPVGEHGRPAGEAGQLGGQHALGRGLERGRVPVPPAAVEPPDVADDELGLVIDRPQVRPGFQVGGRPHGVDGVVQAAAAVHHLERLIDERFKQRGGVGEGLPDPVGADDGQAVPWQQVLGSQPGHPPQRARPFPRVALYLLRIAGVRRRPDEQVAAAQHLPVGQPGHRVIVGLALLVPQQERACRRPRAAARPSRCDPGTGTRSASEAPGRRTAAG